MLFEIYLEPKKIDGVSFDMDDIPPSCILCIGTFGNDRYIDTNFVSIRLIKILNL